jgi:hypothetical protein
MDLGEAIWANVRKNMQRTVPVICFCGDEHRFRDSMEYLEQLTKYYLARRGFIPNSCLLKFEILSLVTILTSFIT